VRHEEVVARVKVPDIIEKLKIQGKVQGKEFIGCCPFPDHNDSTPSFSIAIEGEKKGLYQCFGCSSKGNIIHLVQRCLDLDRADAELQLAKWFGFDKVVYSPSSKELSDLLSKQEEMAVEEDIIRIPLPRVSNDDKDILSYIMTKRSYSIKDAQKIIDTFKIKFSNKGYYKSRAIIPIFDSFGQQVTFEACDVTGQLNPKKLYPKGSPMARLLFNHSEVTGDYTWVVEGIWDAIRMWSFGEPAIATFGAHLSGWQARMIIAKYHDVFLLFDGDDAGREARDKAMKALKPYLNVMEVNLRYGDPDDLKKNDFMELIRWIKR